MKAGSVIRRQKKEPYLGYIWRCHLLIKVFPTGLTGPPDRLCMITFLTPIDGMAMYAWLLVLIDELCLGDVAALLAVCCWCFSRKDARAVL